MQVLSYSLSSFETLVKSILQLVFTEFIKQLLHDTIYVDI